VVSDTIQTDREEMGNIMDDWDEEWKIPSTETSHQCNPTQKYMTSMRRNMKKKGTREKGKGLEDPSPLLTPCNDQREKSQR
jgi:hypothetical protein